MDEDPKILRGFPIPLHDASGATLHYDRLSISPDGKILAATHGATLQWLCAETCKVLDTAEKAHDGESISHFKNRWEQGNERNLYLMHIVFTQLYAPRDVYDLK